ncbi:hypothetical protein ANCDUO_21179 [Ancylostoma duodenale]|uniref:Glycine zipper domain-containing protein n=1 Tax=Ancylostoma duodenale TaxID=51022 RepID=A0A0C2BXP2_9BILA|nr:hypothetical protein ANCDUO_21179 [Ancylostoma duodenale]
MSLVASGFRVGKSIYDELTIDDEIEALEQIVHALEEDMNDPKCCGSERAETEDALVYAKELLTSAYDSKNKKGKKTLHTVVCIGGEYGGAAAVGFGGAQGGAAIGMVGGPVGALAGAVAGNIVGAMVGTEIGASAVENFRYNADGVSTNMQGSLVEWGGGVKGELVDLNGNASIGRNGLELGAHATLLHLADGTQKNFSVGRAGANFDVTKDGVDVGVEGKLVRLEAENERVKVGVGFNLDTGLTLRSDRVKLEALGFGLSYDGDGFGIKLPFLDIKFKK